MKLLRNLRLNLPGFQKDASSRGITLRLSQWQGLKELADFLALSPNEEGQGLAGYYHQPTGAGKTGLFAIEAKLLDVQTLILVPFDNLLEQTKKDLLAIGGFATEDIGLIGGGTYETGRKVTVATYAGHASLLKRDRDYAVFVQQQVELTILDEVQTALGGRTQESILAIDGVQNGELSNVEIADLDAEQEVLEHLNTEGAVRSVKIGFTATPKLAKKHVEQFFPHLIGRVYHADLIEVGCLVPYHLIHCNGTIHEGDIESLDRMTEEQEVSILRREGIYPKLAAKYAASVDQFRKDKEGQSFPLRGMAFCTNHVECQALREEAEALGVRCAIVTGKEAPTGKKGRAVLAEAMQRLRLGEIDLIITVEKLCAGFNFPEINAVLWARITSMAKTIQSIGRGSRSYIENGVTKKFCMVYETNWALEDNAKRRKKPLSIADALAENGEDPKGICSMDDGSELNLDLPVTSEQLRAEIMKNFTAEKWAKMKQGKKGDPQTKMGYMCFEKGLIAIARVFGVEGDPIGYHDVHLELGRAIWGDDPCFRVEELSPALLRAEIMKNYSPMQWAKMKKGDKNDPETKRGLRYLGMGLIGIAGVFGVEGDPISNHAVHLELGREIFANHPCFFVEELTPEQLRAEIMKNFTPEKWAQMKQGKKDDPQTKKGYRCFEKGLIAIAGVFGVEGDPIGNHAVHLELGREIFANHPCFFVEELTPEQLRAEIMKNFTPEKWAQMKQGKKDDPQAKKGYRCFKMGLFAIARAFGIEGNPIGYHDVHLELGRAIWGEEWGPIN